MEDEAEVRETDADATVAVSEDTGFVPVSGIPAEETENTETEVEKD